MGLLGQNQFNYYPSAFGGGGLGDLGNYQFVTIENIISAFTFAYIGEDKIIKI